MSYYQLPKINYKIKADNIKIDFSSEECSIFICESLSKYLMPKYEPKTNNFSNRTKLYHLFLSFHQTFY